MEAGETFFVAFRQVCRSFHRDHEALTARAATAERTTSSSSFGSAGCALSTARGSSAPDEECLRNVARSCCVEALNGDVSDGEALRGLTNTVDIQQDSTSEIVAKTHNDDDTASGTTHAHCTQKLAQRCDEHSANEKQNEKNHISAT